MLEEAVAYLDKEYGRAPEQGRKNRGKVNRMGGYEILVVDDGSKDKTVDVVLDFARKYELHDVLRVSKLAQNRGKGGAVTHGFRHARGAYVVFVDADGASKFEDLGKLVQGCDAVCDQSGRGVAVGSRGHLVGSEAVVKVCMHLSYSYKRMARTNEAPAIFLAQLSHVLIPHASAHPHATSNITYP